MRFRLPIIALSVLSVWLGLAQAQTPVSRDIVATHWLPETAVEARTLTVAAALTLKETRSGELEVSFVERFEAHRNNLSAWFGPAGLTSQLANGHWGGWVLAYRQDFMEPLDFQTISWQHLPEDISAHWPVWQAVAARDVMDIWAQVEALEINRIFQPLVARLDGGLASRHARAQARRIERMGGAQAAQTREIIRGSLLLAEAQFQWGRGDYLDAAWLLVEGLAGIDTGTESPNTRFYMQWLQSLSVEQVRSLRSIDLDFPVIVALLQDSANHLAAGVDEWPMAREKLSQAYARLALLGPSVANYLDQPVRDGLASVYQLCQQALDDASGQNQRMCLQALSESLLSDLASEELVGASGPLSSAFLNRELGLVGWQRARYLDSYLNWQLGGECAIPQWFNVLEWNLGVEYLSQTARLGETLSFASLDALSNQSQQFWAQSRQWLGCVSALDDTREDLMLKLFSQFGQALEVLNQEIDKATVEFSAQTLRPGSDVILDQPINRDTRYRNTALTIGPCEEARSCGSRVALPTDELLLSSVPAGYWLAEQLNLGKVRMCYDNVEWTDRQQASARHNDSGVANYSGRLSFELHAFFDEPGQSHAIFAKRLQTAERKDYFFGKANAENLNLSCAHGLGGQPIESALSDNASGLVPDRLTYFTSVPTTVSAHLLANWDQGAQWRAQVAGETDAEVLVSATDDEIFERAQSQRVSLIDRRERALATRLSNLDSDDQGDLLTEAMREVETLSRLIGQIMALHHGHAARLDETIRARLWGSEGLLGRGDIRRARDQGVWMRDVPALGQQRLESLSDAWLQWPAQLRQAGTLPPELHMADVSLNAAMMRVVSTGAQPEGQ